MENIGITLGARCNFSCKHCHRDKSLEYEYNPDIITHIRVMNPRFVRFHCGEPLVYFDTIKRIMCELGDRFAYKFVSNGSLLNSEMLSFFKDFCVFFAISYDGEKGTRTPFVYNDFQKLVNPYFGCTFYNENNNMDEIFEDYIKLKTRIFGELTYLQKNMFDAFPHIAHATKSNNLFLSRQTIDNYVNGVIKYSIKEFNFCNVNHLPFKNSNFLNIAMNKYFNFSKVHGVKCCCLEDYVISLDGKILLCPYEKTFISDIYKGFNEEKVLEFIPDKCKACDNFYICKRPCIISTTEVECEVFRRLHPFFKWLLTRDEYIESER